MYSNVILVAYRSKSTASGARDREHSVGASEVPKLGGAVSAAGQEAVLVGGVSAVQRVDGIRVARERAYELRAAGRAAVAALDAAVGGHRTGART